MSRRRWIGLAVLLGLPLSQLGHALATVLRSASEDSGGHVYAPALLLAALLALLLPSACAAALLLAAGGRESPRPVVSVLEVATGLLTVQLLAFLFQEAAEAAAVHAEVSGATLLAGLAGQAPVALVAAAMLAWLASRLEPALEVLAEPTREARPHAALLITNEPAAAALEAPEQPGRRLRARAPPARLSSPQ